MRTPERAVADTLLAHAADAGLFIRKCHWESHVGAPDYCILHAGRAFFVETKAPGEKPRLSQLAEFKKIRAAGCPVFVVDCANDILRTIITILEAECLPKQS
jgi:hypothetical protein